MIAEMAAATGWGELPFVVFFGYLGTNAALLGLLTTDLRPVPGKRLVATSSESTQILIPAPESEMGPAAETAQLAAEETRPGLPAGKRGRV
jgi:hypothetical protein